MLGQHFLDIDIGDDRRVLLQGADIDLVGSARRIDGAQFGVADQFDGIADGRVVGDAALEFLALRGPQDLAQQVDRSDGNISVRGRQVLAGHFRDHRDDGRIGAADADKASDRGPDLGDGPVVACRQKSDPGEGSAHRNYASEGNLWHGNIMFRALLWPGLWRVRLEKRLSRRSPVSLKSAINRSAFYLCPATPRCHCKISLENRCLAAGTR